MTWALPKIVRSSGGRWAPADLPACASLRRYRNTAFLATVMPMLVRMECMARRPSSQCQAQDFTPVGQDGTPKTAFMCLGSRNGIESCRFQKFGEQFDTLILEHTCRCM